MEHGVVASSCCTVAERDSSAATELPSLCPFHENFLESFAPFIVHIDGKLRVDECERQLFQRIADLIVRRNIVPVG